MASTPQELSAELKGGRLTGQQVGQLVIRFGGKAVVDNPDRLAGAISVARCESSFNWGASSRNPSGGTNWGGWQIDDASHPDCPKDCATDPLRSTEKVASLTGGFQNWSAWACKPHPSATDHADARKAIADAGEVSESATGASILDPLDKVAAVLEGIAQFFVGLGELLLTPEGWLKMGKILAGGLLVVAGTNRLARQSLGVDPVGKITGAALGAVGGPAGALIGAARG